VGQSQSTFQFQTSFSGSTPSLTRGDSLASSGFLTGSNSGAETPVIGPAEEVCSLLTLSFGNCFRHRALATLLT
jgi:hypothetical protein